MQPERIQDRARGRWKSILPALGIESKYLTGKHSACPVCQGGKDRFRYDDKGGEGTWICSHCGAGNGVDLIMRVKRIEFIEAKRAIEQQIGSAPISVPKVRRGESETESRHRDQMAALWGRARPLDGTDIASRYLIARGISLSEWPKYLRALDDLPYYDEDSARTMHPAMLAKFASSDGSAAILHRTYLAEPGCKASVAKPRMIMPGRIPIGGAVRLSDAAETMGVAEGIETALSASLIFGIPVWACLSAGAMIKWKSPAAAKHILIFGDNDLSLAGQNAAYSLGYRLRTEGFEVEVRIPQERGTDWNDELAGSPAADQSKGRRQSGAAERLRWQMTAARAMKRLPELKAGTRGSPERRLVATTEVMRPIQERDDRPTKDQLTREQAMSVAVAQPHRRGSDDPKLGTALGRFCAARKLGSHCWLAGTRYLEIVQDAKLAQGFGITGGSWGSDGGYQTLTDEQIEARKDLALIRLKEAHVVLRTIMQRLPAAMERLVYDDREPSPYDEAMLVHGLVALAMAWGYLKPRYGET